MIKFNKTTTPINCPGPRVVGEVRGAEEEGVMRFTAATALLVVFMVALGGPMGTAWAGSDEAKSATKPGDYAKGDAAWRRKDFA